MDIRILQENKNYNYDPVVVGYDTQYWVAVTGTPTTNGSGTSKVMRVNAADVASLAYHLYGSFNFRLVVPAVPTTGDVRFWGLSVPGYGNGSRVGFQIVGTVLSAVFYDEDGTLVSSQAITWDASWTAAAANYGVIIGRDMISWSINGTVVWKYTFTMNTLDNLSRDACNIRVTNGNSDNLDIGVIRVREVQSFA